MFDTMTVPTESEAAARWEHAAAGVLRKMRKSDVADADAWDLLAGHSLDGVVIPPLGTADRMREPPPGARGVVREPGAGWDIRTLLTDQNATRVAHDAVTDLENGATSIWLTVGGAGVRPDEISAALAGVYLDLAPVVLRVSGAVGALDVARLFVEHLAAQGVSAAAGTSFGADPISRGLRRGAPLDRKTVSDEAASLAGVAAAAGVGALVVDGTTAHDLGAAEVGELGYSIALGVAYLRILADAGFDLATSLNLVDFRYAATADQFLTIAKLRAARALWARVGELCGALAQQRQHAVSSAPMMTRYDPWNNLLRGTVAAFAAGVAGAEAVTVIPFDARLGRPEPLGRRLARNTSSLLISEARVAQVSDPAGGAFAVEMLTDELADRGWSEFQRIEAAGGVVATISDGSLRAGFSTTAVSRQRRIAVRTMPITGVTEFPNPGETLLHREQQHDLDDAPSWAEDFEELRDDPAGERVLLATLGPAADHNARATFAANAFAAGAIGVERTGANLTEVETAAAFRAAGLSVACLAGSDTAYRATGPALVTALRAAGARWIVIAGKPPVELAGAVDDQLVRGADLLDFLRRTRGQLSPARVAR